MSSNKTVLTINSTTITYSLLDTAYEKFLRGKQHPVKFFQTGFVYSLPNTDLCLLVGVSGDLRFVPLNSKTTELITRLWSEDNTDIDTFRAIVLAWIQEIISRPFRFIVAKSPCGELQTTITGRSLLHLQRISFRVPAPDHVDYQDARQMLTLAGDWFRSVQKD